ncbi:DUF5071 domain-containing protein [Lysinibacillus sphaericus]|uniref:DUF5071 domain-containing protein n=2 Tax=Lysinibacillus TaxID=400634 RepID=A0A2S0K5N0_LYSSH|nr:MULTISPECIES: DUF5071 domain-containing protein [Lysinibacillus]AVK98687.1 DUF5071 domain-containing protein [Lysinibacillus sphaericus]TKI21374.1 DUF5071 domain-containing protein [Lysinibacillus sphaericus]TKI49014.1 DUF5071 domain-containing protein [Lysinibacillus tabacifolii]UDK95163.1 DUF5071 domain-containing protein [Lysinibacillus sphaericus]SUV15320.1 Uncharacterised protein [Lysinibacillus sphaericus]
MEGYEDYLPLNIYDVDKVEKLKKLDRNVLEPLLPDLLEYTQDMNWPVASGVVEILLTFPKEIVSHVQAILSSNDDNWKWFILHFLVIKLPVESQVQFKQYLIRVAQTPTQNEIAEELDEIAKEIVDML